MISGIIAASSSKLITCMLSARATSRGSGFSPRRPIATSAAAKLLSISPCRSSGPSALTIMFGAAACKSATNCSSAAASGELTIISLPLTIMLAFGELWIMGKISASTAAAGISAAKLSSTSATHLSASAPNVVLIAPITVFCSASSPTFILQAYKVLPSPVATRNDANSISLATAATGSSLTCSSVTIGVATGSGLSWQPRSNAQANAPKIIRPIIGNSAFIKLPDFSSSCTNGAMLVVSEIRSPAGAAISIPAGTTPAAQAGI